jgi:hypothetical protein
MPARRTVLLMEPDMRQPVVAPLGPTAAQCLYNLFPEALVPSHCC